MDLFSNAIHGTRTRIIKMGDTDQMSDKEEGYSRKGEKLIHSIIHNWLDETGEIPTYQEIVTHIFQMENKEFDGFLIQQDYFFRKEMHEEGERQQREHENKKLRNVKKKNKNKKDSRIDEIPITTTTET